MANDATRAPVVQVLSADGRAQIAPGDTSVLLVAAGLTNTGELQSLGSVTAYKVTWGDFF